MAEEIGILEFQAETDGPIWFINHYLDVASSNYLKLLSLREICHRFYHGANDEDFVIAANSFELFPESDSHRYDPRKVVPLESKDRSPENFWNLFKNLHRPIILFRREPIFDPHSESGLKLRRLSLNSPLDVSLEGNVGALSDLVRGRTFAARDNEHITTSIQNVRDIVETSHLIEDPRTPPGVRAFARDQLEALMNKQHRINQKLGIRQASIRPRRR
jgi:hypothetical protein